MGGRGSASKGNKGGSGSITDSEYSLLETSMQYGLYISPNPDMSAFDYAGKYGLNKNEVNLIHSYTADLFESLNNDIRDGQKGITDFVKDKLNNAINKLPSVKKTVFRGINVDNPKGFAASLKKMDSFKFDSFTSTSSDRSGIKLFAKKDKGIIFEINSKKGKDISKLSTEKKEKEVLFKAGTKFRYKGQRESEGFIYVKLDEI